VPKNTRGRQGRNAPAKRSGDRANARGVRDQRTRPDRTVAGGRGDGRLTKAERKEQARIERVEIQRRMHRQRRVRGATIGVAIVAAVALIVAVVIAQQSQALPGPDELIKQATSATSVAGCGKVQTVPPYSSSNPDLDRTHIGTPGSPVRTPPALKDYSSIPPASGPHNPTPLPAGEYSSPPDVYQTIHSLEHGAVIIWYDPSAAGDSAVKDVKTYFQAGPNGKDPQKGAKVIIAPYSYPDEEEAGRLPAGSQMALVAWHHLQECAHPSLAVAYDFVAKYRVPPSSGQKYLGDAPEPQTPI
jgi:uncharacterized protein DUF3105